MTWSQTTRGGKRVPPRNMRDDDVVSPLRMRVETPDGVLVVYDAALPPGVEPGCSGYLVYYSSKEDQSRHVFGGLVETQAQLAEVLGQLADELDVTLEDLTDADERIEEALTVLQQDAPDRSRRIRSDKSDDDRTRPVWEPATVENAAQIMGFDPVQLRDDEGVEGTVALECGPCYASLPPPQRCGSAHGVFAEASRVAVGCCGGDPLPPNDDPPDNCNPPPANDLDCDGIPNSSDGDIDNDGIPNGSDPDVDGDGTPNGSDPDVDGDGIGNGSDGDVNNDGIGNGGDSDIDGDGLPNNQDPDPDGDGLPNSGDGDDDGDGNPDGGDSEPIGCTTDCPGACCTKASGTCQSKKQSLCLPLDDYYFKGKEVPCTPNPCCVIGTNTQYVATTASISQVAPSRPIDQTIDRAGLVYNERVDVTISAVCDGDQWCAVVQSLFGRFSFQADISPSLEVTGPAGGNTTQANFCDQVHDMDVGPVFDLGGGTTWYMLAAVVAHENVHLTRVEPCLEQVAPQIEGFFEQLCVAHTPGKTENQAIAEIRALSGFADDLRISRTFWNACAADFVDADHAGQCLVKERVPLEPMMAAICAHAHANCWPHCFACPEPRKGACCNINTGGCLMRDSCECLNDGGWFHGETATCGPPNPCVGACCLSATQCLLTTPSNCAGTFHGTSTLCTPNPCGPGG